MICCHSMSGRGLIPQSLPNTENPGEERAFKITLVQNVTGSTCLIRSSCLVEFQVNSEFHPLHWLNGSVVTSFVRRGNNRIVIYLCTLRTRKGGRPLRYLICIYIQERFCVGSKMHLQKESYRSGVQSPIMRRP